MYVYTKTNVLTYVKLFASNARAAGCVKNAFQGVPRASVSFSISSDMRLAVRESLWSADWESINEAIGLAEGTLLFLLKEINDDHSYSCMRTSPAGSYYTHDCRSDSYMRSSPTIYPSPRTAPGPGHRHVRRSGGSYGPLQGPLLCELLASQVVARHMPSLISFNIIGHHSTQTNAHRRSW